MAGITEKNIKGQITVGLDLLIRSFMNIDLIFCKFC